MEIEKVICFRYKMPKWLFIIVLFFCTSIFSSQASYSKAFSKPIVKTESEQACKNIKANKKTVCYKLPSYKKIVHIIYCCYDKTLVLVIQNNIEKVKCAQHIKNYFPICLIEKFSPIISFPKENTEPAPASIKG
jgi:hypothetical protein